MNPIKHLDWFGSVLLPIIMIATNIGFVFGWAKPVPINPYALRRRSSAAPMLVSLAGPMSNFLMALIAGIFFRVGLVSISDISAPTGILPTGATFLFMFIRINLLLMLFNLIPLYPLDGEKVLEYFLPPAGLRVLDSIRPFSPIILMGVFFLLPMLGFDVLGTVLLPALNAITGFLIGV